MIREDSFVDGHDIVGRVQFHGVDGYRGIAVHHNRSRTIVGFDGYITSFNGEFSVTTGL